MKVSVDYDLCEANGLCEGVAPTVFELDDDDQLQLLRDDVEGEELAGARRAATICPKAAILLAEDA